MIMGLGLLVNCVSHFENIVVIITYKHLNEP